MPPRPPQAQYAAEVAKLLSKHYPKAICALDFRTPLELLVATILSAQCTDVRVNLVTKDLFKKYRSAADYANADPDALRADIKSTGFFNAKAKSLMGCCQALVDHYGGKVPQDFDALVELPGIGRKTANCVMGNAFGVASGVVVDTHVMRLSQRLGLSEEKDANKIERDLIRLLPKRQWIDFSHRMIHHGRQVCVARRPKCDICPLGEICPRIGVKSDRL